MKAKNSSTRQPFFKFLLIPLITILMFSCETYPDTESPWDARVYVRVFDGSSEISSISFNLDENDSSLKNKYLGPIKRTATNIRINKNISSYKLKITIKTYAKNSSGSNYLLNTYSVLTSRMGNQNITTNNQEIPLEYAMVDIEYLE